MKFLIIKHRGDGVTAAPDSITVIFAKYEDGMVIGSVQNDIARFGEDPQSPLVRAFVSHDCAFAWVKGKCKEFAGRDDVDFIERAPEPRIVVARSGMPQQRKM